MGNLVRALFYLRVMSLLNAVKSRLLRLKQPKYMAGAIIGAAYVYYFFLRRFTAPRDRYTEAMSMAFPLEHLPMVAGIGALLLLVFVAMYWLLPRDRAALSFTEAEIAFLFPAPISRRTLIHYRLINAQMRLLFSSLLIGVISAVWVVFLGNAAIRILGWWLIFATISLHMFGSSFAITRLLDGGMTSLRRQLVTLGLIVAVVGGASFWVWSTLRAPAAEDLASFGAAARYFGTLLSEGPLSWVLLPAKWVIAPVLAPDWATFFMALGPALLVYAAHYVWVLRSEVSFEEASIAKAEKRAARVAAMRSGKLRIGGTEAKARRAPFDISGVRPELAFLWKNLLSTAGFLRPRNAVIAAAIIVAASFWLTNGEHENWRRAVSLMSLVGAGYVAFFGPLIMRQDLRTDLPNTDILKTYPLPGWRIVLGEMLTPIAIITVLLWLFLLAISLTFQLERLTWLTPGIRAAITIGLALVAPLLCALQIMVLNMAYLIMPAWTLANQGRASGIDVVGQRILFLAGLLIVIGLALVPASVAASAIFFVAQWVVGVPIAGAMALLAVLAILCLEIGIGVRWLGHRFDQFDLSAELRP